MKRAERRHHKQRMQARVYWIDTVVHNNDPLTDADWLHWHVRKNADNRQPCSCFMCGNPRRHFRERTHAEVRSKMDFEEQMRDLDGVWCQPPEILHGYTMWDGWKYYDVVEDMYFTDTMREVLPQS